MRPNEKWERRDKKKRNKRKMGVDGRSIFTIVEIQRKRAKDGEKDSRNSN